MKNLIKLLFFTIFWVACTQKPKPRQPYLWVVDWVNMHLYITQHTPMNTPTFAARCLAYLELMQYESLVHGFQNYNSLGTHLNGLGKMPEPPKGLRLNCYLVMNHANTLFLKSIYQQTSDANKQKIDSLENALEKEILAQFPASQAEIKTSKDFAQKLAHAMIKYASSDGGHRAYLHNFEANYVPPTFKGAWQPALFAQALDHRPLHPKWGENRTFTKQANELPVPSYMSYSEDPNSSYYQQFKQVYEKRKKLTQAEKELAIWWSDDPSETITPGGHSIYLTTQLIKKYQPDIIETARIYALVGMAISDAYVLCWRWKYRFFSERPNTFIMRVIDPTWESFWPDPPFPAFPSGHAIQASAAAWSLMSTFPNQTTFYDSLHVGRPPDRIRNTTFKVRKLTSIWSMAEEAAHSRFLGGIHVPLDNQTGLEEGKKIAQPLIELPWKK